jgi:3'(2'), 5'-bisphosphate nucleotidase
MVKLLELALEAALFAGKEIIEVYEDINFRTEYKTDNSPLTLADKKSHQVIISTLKKTNLNIISEEGVQIQYQKRKLWKQFWMIDPLDGTKEFIHRNGEFTVNIALIDIDLPVLGVIFVPISNTLYFSIQGKGAYLCKNFNQSMIPYIFTNSERLPLKNENTNLNFSVVVSRSHMNEETNHYINDLKQEHGNINLIKTGSSLKICMVAEGKANQYPRFGPTMEWDTAAGHAIAIEAGCSFTQINNSLPFIYNKENLLNPFFIVKR